MSAAVSRRALVGGAGKLVVTATLVGLPAVSTAASAYPDAAIIEALHTWHAACVAYTLSPSEADEAVWSGMVQKAHDALASVADLPPQTMEGLAIKAYLALRHELGGAGEYDLLVAFDNSTMIENPVSMGVVNDAQRLSPTLAAIIVERGELRP